MLEDVPVAEEVDDGRGRVEVERFVSEVVAFEDGTVSEFSPTRTVQAFEL